MLMTWGSHRFIYIFISRRHLRSPLTGICLHDKIPFELNCEYAAFFFVVVVLLSLENSQRALGQSDPGTSVKRGLHQTSKNCSSEDRWISTYTTRA